MDIFIVCVALIYIRDHYFLEVLSDLHIMILTRFICLFDESMIECVFFLFLLSFCGQGTIFNTFTVGGYSLSFHSLLFLKHSISILEKY